jgi:hypothetical protein
VSRPSKVSGFGVVAAEAHRFGPAMRTLCGAVADEMWIVCASDVVLTRPEEVAACRLVGDEEGVADLDRAVLGTFAPSEAE